VINNCAWRKADDAAGKALSSLAFLMIWLGIGLLWGILIIWLYRREVRTGAPGYAADLVAGGVLLGLTVGFFWRTVSGDVYQPADGGDLVSFLFPTYRFAATQIQQGSLPLWNPTLYAGAPFIGDIQAGFLYPPNFLLFWLWPNFDYTVMQWLVIGHLYWCGLGLYVFLRTWQWADTPPLTRPAALFGALAFQFSDPLLVHVGNLNLIAVLSWLPWILVLYHQALRRGSIRWAAGAGVCFALANFAGHAQSTFYVGLVVGLYTLGYWWLARRHWCWRLPALLAQLQYPVVFYAMTFLLSAPLLLPTLELARYTERNAFSYQDTVAFSLAPTQVIGLLTPGFFGRGPALHWSLWARVETPYAGVATLLLAAAALLLALPHLRPRLWLWGGIALFGLGTALGVYGPLHGWLTALVPFFDQFRAPARALVLWTFGLAILGAHGVDALAHHWRPWPGRVAEGPRLFRQGLRWGALMLAGVMTPLLYLALLLTQENETAFLRASVAALAVTLAAGFWLGTWALVSAHRLGWVSTRRVGLLLLLLLYVDLAATGAYTDISPVDPTSGYQHPALIAFLQGEAAALAPEPMRIDTLTEIADQWQPDTAAVYGLQDVGGIANPLLLQPWRQLWETLGSRAARLYDMLNVRYVIVRDGTPLPEGKFTLAFDAPGPLAAYRNEQALGRAWLVHEAHVVADQAAAWAALQAPDFDPSRTAVVVAPETPLPLDAPTASEQVQLLAYESNALLLQVTAHAPALLVVSELWYPGWKVTIDEKPAPLLLVNGALRGVGVPTGSHMVRFHFAPASWRIGLLAAIAGWGLLIVILVFQRTRERNRPSSP